MPLALFVLGLTLRLADAYPEDWLYDWEKQQILVHGIATGIGSIALVVVVSERARIRRWAPRIAIALATAITVVGFVVWASQQYSIRY